MMKKLYLLLLTAGLSVPTMAQENYELGKPNNEDYRYLDEYQALKEYIDYSKYLHIVARSQLRGRRVYQEHQI